MPKLSAGSRNHTVATRLGITFDEANTLRLASLALHRWAEKECGEGSALASWAIERDEKTDLPYLCTYPHNGKMSRHRIADKEKGALRRIANICKANGLHYYHQTDPRGCALYVAREPLTDSDYNRGVAIY